MHGIGFFDTFSPVVKWSPLCIVPTIATSHGWMIFMKRLDEAKARVH